MSTPYRDQDTSLVAVQRGACPWCRAPVTFATTDETAVCDRCGARYAPSLATWQPTSPPAVARSRVGYFAVLAGIAVAGVVLIPLALALLVVGAAIAVTLYLGIVNLGFGLPGLQTRKQLAEPAEPRTDEANPPHERPR